jgi:hypothetical protein
MCESMPYHCDDCDTWHLTHYWLEDDGSVTSTDDDGNPDFEERFPTAEEFRAAWTEYYKDMLETGKDPLREVPGKQVKVKHRWQVLITPSILGPCLSACRPARLNQGILRGRGEWLMYPAELPAELLEFLCIEPTGRGSNVYRDCREYWQVLDANANARRERPRDRDWRGTIEWIEIRYALPTPAEVRAAARRYLK